MAMWAGRWKHASVNSPSRLPARPLPAYVTASGTGLPMSIPTPESAAEAGDMAVISRGAMVDTGDRTDAAVTTGLPGAVRAGLDVRTPATGAFVRCAVESGVRRLEECDRVAVTTLKVADMRRLEGEA